MKLSLTVFTWRFSSRSHCLEIQRWKTQHRKKNNSLTRPPRQRRPYLKGLNFMKCVRAPDNYLLRFIIRHQFFVKCRVFIFYNVWWIRIPLSAAGRALAAITNNWLSDRRFKAIKQIGPADGDTNTGAGHLMGFLHSWRGCPAMGSEGNNSK